MKAEIICPSRLTSAVKRFRRPSEARDNLELRPLAKPVVYLWASMLQTRERWARNRILLQIAGTPRDAVKTEDFKQVHSKRPYAFVCWMSASVVLRGRRRAHFGENRVSP